MNIYLFILSFVLALAPLNLATLSHVNKSPSSNSAAPFAALLLTLTNTIGYFLLAQYYLYLASVEKIRRDIRTLVDEELARIHIEVWERIPLKIQEEHTRLKSLGMQVIEASLTFFEKTLELLTTLHTAHTNLLMVWNQELQAWQKAQASYMDKYNKAFYMGDTQAREDALEEALKTLSLSQKQSYKKLLEAEEHLSELTSSCELFSGLLVDYEDRLAELYEALDPEEYDPLQEALGNVRLARHITMKACNEVGLSSPMGRRARLSEQVAEEKARAHQQFQEALESVEPRAERIRDAQYEMYEDVDRVFKSGFILSYMDISPLFFELTQYAPFSTYIKKSYENLRLQIEMSLVQENRQGPEIANLKNKGLAAWDSTSIAKAKAAGEFIKAHEEAFTVFYKAYEETEVSFSSVRSIYFEFMPDIYDLRFYTETHVINIVEFIKALGKAKHTFLFTTS
jgi:hypothetical protein